MKDKGTKDTVSKVLNIIKSNLSNLMLAGLFIIFGVVLYIIFRSNPENFKDFTAIAWLALVLVTAIYACATVMILIENRRTIREMRQSRLDAVKPALSLQPEGFTFGGDFSLYLRNSGGVAREVKIDIEVTKPPSKNVLYVPALNKEHIVRLPLETTKEIYEAGGLVKVVVSFKDSYNQSLTETPQMDFSNLKEEGREIIGQYSEQYEIIEALKDIERKIK
jgi:hypothetical protein